LRPDVDSKANLDRLPTIILAGRHLLATRDAKEEMLEFIRRYKGPRTNEADVQANEVILKMTPHWVITV